MPAEVKGGTEGGDRPPGPRRPLSGHGSFQSKAGSHWKDLSRGKIGVWFTCLRTDSRRSAENRSQGVQKGCYSPHSKGAGGGRGGEKWSDAGFQAHTTRRRRLPPLPQRGRQGQGAVRSELQARCSSANSPADSCVRELAERAQAGLRSVRPSAQR